MNGTTFFRFSLYIAGLVASGAAFLGYADFDIQTRTVDIYPFNLKEALISLFNLGTNGLAAMAVLKGWGKK